MDLMKPIGIAPLGVLVVRRPPYASLMHVNDGDDFSLDALQLSKLQAGLGTSLLFGSYGRGPI